MSTLPTPLEFAQNVIVLVPGVNTYLNVLTVEAVSLRDRNASVNLLKLGESVVLSTAIVNTPKVAASL